MLEDKREKVKYGSAIFDFTPENLEAIRLVNEKLRMAERQLVDQAQNFRNKMFGTDGSGMLGEWMYIKLEGIIEVYNADCDFCEKDCSVCTRTSLDSGDERVRDCKFDLITDIHPLLMEDTKYNDYLECEELGDIRICYSFYYFLRHTPMTLMDMVCVKSVWNELNSKVQKCYSLKRKRGERLLPHEVDDCRIFNQAELGQLPPTWEERVCFEEGIATVRIGNRAGAVDRSGEIIVPILYGSVDNMCEGLALVTKTCTWLEGQRTVQGIGYVDVHGEEVIPLIYEDGHPFSEGLAGVKKERKWGFINTSGECVIGFQYDKVEKYCRFCDGMTAVQSAQKWGFIDKDNRICVPFRWDYASVLNGALCVGEKDASGLLRYGLLSPTGSQLTSVCYDRPLDPFTNGYSWARRDYRPLVLDVHGNEYKVAAGSGISLRKQLICGLAWRVK